MEGHDTAFVSGFGKGDLLSSIRHSLRTPLNQIIGYSEMLQEEAEDLGQTRFIPDLQKIHTAGGQLLALINDGMAPWKIEAGKIDLDTMRLEMRTPLNVIIGFSELCQEEAEDLKLSKLIADLQKINTAAKNLLTLFEDSNLPAQLEINPRGPKPQAGARTASRPALVVGPQVQVESAPALDVILGSLLVVDDNEMNRDMLTRRLERQGYSVTAVENGRQALDLLRTRQFDLILLDIIMPEMNGFQTLEALKKEKDLRHMPVIMLSALDEIDGAVRCIEIGAEDYLPKPFNPVLLNARISASLEKKRLRDQEQAYLEMLQAEQEKSERLLLSILPKPIADRLKRGETSIADHFPDVTVLFADLVGFTELSSHTSAPELVRLLDEVFSGFDWLAQRHGLEKIKTSGDSYMVVGGLPTPRPDHAEAVAEIALDMQREIARFNAQNRESLSIRIGISSGPVVAGIIGRNKFIYDLWGDTVNMASRMESMGRPGEIQMTADTYECLKDKYHLEDRGAIEVKGKGRMNTYLLTGRLIHKAG